jgi:hypothetical protein
MIRLTILSTLGQCIHNLAETDNKFIHKLSFGIGKPKPKKASKEK